MPIHPLSLLCPLVLETIFQVTNSGLGASRTGRHSACVSHFSPPFTSDSLLYSIVKGRQRKLPSVQPGVDYVEAVVGVLDECAFVAGGARGRWGHLEGRARGCRGATERGAAGGEMVWLLLSGDERRGDLKEERQEREKRRGSSSCSHLSVVRGSTTAASRGHGKNCF